MKNEMHEEQYKGKEEMDRKIENLLNKDSDEQKWTIIVNTTSLYS